MLPGRTAILALLLLAAWALSLTSATAAEPSVGFNGWTNVPGVVEGTINVHPVNTTLPKPALGYVDYLPKGYNPSDTITKWPVVFALLGVGEQGDGTDTAANGHQLLTKMTENGPLLNVASQQWDFPCIVICPQAAGPWSNANTIKLMVDYVKANYRVDTTRLYMTGLADGASGTLRFATAFPNILAGIVPIEPTYGPTTSAESDAIKHLPMWMAQCFSDAALNRRNAIAWFNQATQAETGLASDMMASYPGYGSVNHYACETDPATGLPLSPTGPSSTVANAVLTNGSATVALPSGNLIANAGSFYPALWGGSDAAPFTRVTFGADATSYVVKSVSATNIVLTHPYSGASLTADAHIATPNGLQLGGFYLPASATWTWTRTPAQQPANTTDTRVFSMFWQYDNTTAWVNTYLNGQMWNWLFVRPQVRTVATLTLSGLSKTYDGTAQTVTVTTSPSNLPVNVTYSGTSAPFGAGSYVVVATVADPAYSGTATGTMVVAPAPLIITLGGLSTVYDGTPKMPAVGTSVPGIGAVLTYAAGLPPTEPGSYVVNASSGSTNYIGTASGTLVIAKAPATIALGQLSVSFDGNPKPLAATTIPAGLNVAVTYNGSATPPSALGTYAIAATIVDAHYQGLAIGTMNITSTTATVSLAGLTATYDGSPHAVSATTVPAGLATTITYDGSSSPPTAAGSYAVVANVADANLTGSASGTLVIAKATATLTLASTTATYDGLPHTVDVTTTPAGLANAVTYDFSPLSPLPVNAGPHQVTATITDPNYTGSVQGQLLIGRASVSISVSDQTATYDGFLHPVTFTTTPPGVTCSTTYTSGNGTFTPVNAGTYAVTVWANDPNYFEVHAQATLVIAPIPATITLSNLTQAYDGSAHQVTVTTTPPGLGTFVTYNGQGGGVQTVGPHPVLATINDPNYSGSVTGTLTIIPGTETVALSGLTTTYNGFPHSAVATASPFNVQTAITYNGSLIPPTAAGQYAVVATITDASYTGSATGTMTINPLGATVSIFGLSAVYDGNAHSVSVTTNPAGLTTSITYDGNPAAPTAVGDHVVVATVTSPNYTGSATATLTITNPGPPPTEPTVGYNGWTNVPGVVEGSIVVYPVDTTLPKPPLGFVAYFPKGYNQADTTTKWPVVMYLAGIGEAGDGTNNAANGFQLYGHMTTHGPLYQIVNFAWDFPAIIIAPQAPSNWNSTNSIKAEMEYVKTNLRADPKHLYLTGLCDGACGVLRYAAAYPNDPAAILPIEAGVMPGTGQAAAIKNIPTWAAHCFADPESTARTVSIAWVDGSTAADAGVTSDCMANYPGYGATPRNHYACDSDPLTGFPLIPNGPTSSFNATVTSANKYVAFNATLGSSIYLMWSASTDAQPFARFYVPTGTPNADFWAKAGVMLRDSTDSGSKQAIVAQMPNNEVTFQWRDTTNGGSDWIGVRVGGTDLVKTVKLVKTGNLFTAMYSTDGVNFVAMGSHTIVFDNATYRAGLEVSAHNNGTTYTQTFSKVAINGAAPGALTDADIGTAGNPAFAGSASLAGGVYTVTGSGSDIWDNNDHFNYDSQAASGDTTISAQVSTNVAYYPMATVYPTGFYASKPYVGATGTVPITVVTPIGYNVTGSFAPATGWSWARDQHLDTSKPGKHIFTMFWYEDHVQGWRDTWGNPEVWNWLFSQTHP